MTAAKALCNLDFSACRLERVDTTWNLIMRKSGDQNCKWSSHCDRLRCQLTISQLVSDLRLSLQVIRMPNTCRTMHPSMTALMELMLDGVGLTVETGTQSVHPQPLKFRVRSFDAAGWRDIGKSKGSAIQPARHGEQVLPLRYLLKQSSCS